MARGRVAFVLSVVLAGACGGEALLEEAPTELQELAVGGGNVRVAVLAEGIAVSWQDPETGAGTLARHDAALAELWRVEFGAGQPLAVRAWGDRIVSLAAEEVFVFDAGGKIVGQWPVFGARDVAVAGARLLVLTDGGVLELDATGAQVATHPVPSDFIAFALEASEAGYCPTGFIGDDNVTTCFGFDGAQSPVTLTHPGSAPSVERDFSVLSRDGVVSALSYNIDGVNLHSLALADGRLLGAHEFEFDPQSEPVKVFLGPGERVMWLENEDWCDDNCHIGFRIGMLDASRSRPAWRSDLFAVVGTVGNMWTAVADERRIYVASDRAVYVVSSE